MPFFKIRYLLVFAIGALCCTNANAQIDTMSVEQQVALVQDYINANQYRKAKDILQFLYINDQQNPDYITKIGFCDYQLGSLRDAQLYFKESLKFDSLNAFALSYLGLIADKNRAYDEAQSYYKQLLQVDSTNSYYYKQNGYIAKKREEYFEAVGFFNTAYYYNKNDIVVISELCKLFIGLKQYDYADYMIAEGLKLDSTSIEIIHHQIQSNFDQKRYDVVTEVGAQALRLQDTTAFYVKMMGFSHIRQEQYQEAIGVLSMIIKKEKKKELVYYYMATAYAGLAQNDEAVKHYELAIDAGISEKVSDYYKKIGMLHETDSQLKKALKAYEKAHFFSEDPIYLYYMARDADNYYKDKKIALRYYERYLKTGHEEYRDYVNTRITYLKERIHLAGGK